MHNLIAIYFGKESLKTGDIENQIDRILDEHYELRNLCQI